MAARQNSTARQNDGVPEAFGKARGVVFGCVTAIILYTVLALLIVAPLQRGGRPVESLFPLTFGALMPLAVFAGSVWSGWMLARRVARREDWLWLVPGFWIAAVFVFNSATTHQLGLPVTLACGVWWTLVSVAGLALGTRLKR